MQVSDSVHAIRHAFRLSFGDGRFAERFVYSYLIVGKTLCLVDTGVAATAPMLLDYIKGLGRSPEEIAMILLTHSHADHIGGAAAIKREAPAAVVAVHPTERAWVEDLQQQYRERPIPNFFDLVGENLPVDHTLKDGEIISWEEGKAIRVLETPGHSPGSVSFFLEGGGVLVTGDAVPAANAIPIYVDPAASLASVHRLAEVQGVRLLLSSWDEPISGDRISRVMFESGRYIERIDALVREIHGKEPDLSLETLSRRVLEALGISLPMVFFMVQHSFKGHLDRISP
jgi:glyoxylase-like metal-dependent hydrolase (beta-lactamase superfamily II)